MSIRIACLPRPRFRRGPQRGAGGRWLGQSCWPCRSDARSRRTDPSAVDWAMDEPITGATTRSRTRDCMIHLLSLSQSTSPQVGRVRREPPANLEIAGSLSETACMLKTVERHSEKGPNPLGKIPITARLRPTARRSGPARHPAQGRTAGQAAGCVHQMDRWRRSRSPRPRDRQARGSRCHGCAHP